MVLNFKRQTIQLTDMVLKGLLNAIKPDIYILMFFYKLNVY